ncbi:serine--tRNA ligase [Candidatus Peregrinibacteria bacterium]|nr:serine--tRNA ligase [Candidatus Peregrinibacteria bacterium]
MIDLKLLREKPEEIKARLKKKHIEPTRIDGILSLDAEKRNITQDIEELQAKRNKVSKEMPKLKGAEKEKMLGEMQFVKERLAELEPRLKKMDEELNALLITIPNPPLESVPEGKNDADNKSIKVAGKAPKFDFEPLDHVQLGKKADSIDIESGVAMSGARFYYLKNQAVLLEIALINFVVSKLVAKGFQPVIPPVLVKEHAMFGTGFFPADRNEIYHVNPEDDDLYLVGTSEVPLCMMYADKVIPAEELPKRYVGFSTCFRREAGSYGKDTQGILRVHQFDKLEMFSFCHPDKSEEEHELIRSIEEEIMSEIGLHYQVLNICGGDLGAPAAKKYDVEAWIPTQGKFRELTSCSNCTDFQARRANIKFKDETGKNQFVHTLNGTATAMGRMIIAIMENFQKKDGTIEIPKCLRKFMLT